MDTLKEKSLAIYETHEENQWPTHERMLAWRDEIFRQLGNALVELNPDTIFPFVRIGDRGECYIELPAAIPIMFQVLWDRQRGVVIRKLYPASGRFCVGLYDKGRWLHPIWNPQYCFMDLDVAIGRAYGEVHSAYQGSEEEE